MTRDEIKINLDGIIEQLNKLEQSETQSYAELGRKVLPGLAEGTHTDLIAQIRMTEKKLMALRNDQLSLESEYQQSIIAATCFYCKAINSDGAVFCEECGKKLGEKPKEYCEACSTMNYPGQKFCGECGAKLAE